MKKDTVARLVSYLREKGCDAALVTAPVNLLYLTGSVFNGYAYIASDGSFLAFARRKSGAPEDAVLIRKPEDIPKILLDSGLSLPLNVMLEDDYLSFGDYKRLSAVFPDAEKVPSFIRKVRELKTPREIKILGRSAALQVEFFRRVPSLFSAGMTDTEFAAELSRELIGSGHPGFSRTFGLSFEPCLVSVLAGDNAQNPSPYDFSLGGKGLSGAYPFGPSGVTIKPGNTVMVDFCGNLDGYMTDMTRTFSYGRISAQAEAAHNVALDIMSAIEKALVPGAVCEDIYAISEEIVDKSGLRKYHMSSVQGARFVGHGTSLEINETPVLCRGSKDKLMPGHIIAVEPKFVVPGTGPVGVEDTFLITESGPRRLTDHPRDITPLL